jgi:transposase InsO family protein
MRIAGLEGMCKKRWRKTTVADPEAEAAKDLIQRHFGPCQEIDRRYVGDITYIATWEGWAYLAKVIDLASRKVVGWALSNHMRTELVEDALAAALRQPTTGRGCHCSLGPRLPIHQSGLRRAGQGQRRRVVGGQEGRVLGQYGGRILLRHHQAGAHRHEVLADEGRTQPCRLRVHRRVV